MTGLSWVDALLLSNSAERKALRLSLIESIRYFKAQWKKRNGKSELVSSDKAAEELADTLIKSKDLQFIGFVPTTMYIKESGSKEELEGLWNHEWGMPGLLYKHKDLPLLMIAGPSIRLHDSLIYEIDANRENVVPLKGISS